MLSIFEIGGRFTFSDINQTIKFGHSSRKGSVVGKMVVINDRTVSDSASTKKLTFFGFRLKVVTDYRGGTR